LALESSADKQERQILEHRLAGYSIRETARLTGTSVYRVRKVLRQLQDRYQREACSKLPGAPSGEPGARNPQVSRDFPMRSKLFQALQAKGNSRPAKTSVARMNKKGKQPARPERSERANLTPTSSAG
jgi:hypothetical protein